MITEMLERGETPTTIARAVDLTSANVSALMRNESQQPRWITGEKIIKLHKKIMRRYPKVDARA